MKKQFYTGIAEDTRPELEQSRDWKSEDLFGAGSPTWIERGETNWMKPILIRNQNGSSQCMAYSGAKQLGVNEMKENGAFVNLSPTFIYRKRANPTDGMFMQDLLDLMTTIGSPKDTWFPCDNMTDAQIEKAPEPNMETLIEALKYRGKSYVQTPAFNINGLAQGVDTVGSCIIIIRCNINEWTSKPFIDPEKTKADWNVNHGVVCLQYGLIDGKKYVLVEDSWGWSKSPAGQRWISEDFIKERMFGGGYVFDLTTPAIVKPKYNFKVNLKKGMVSSDVKMLQKILILEGCLPEADANTGWGIFGQRTLNAVIKLQEKYRAEILQPSNLTKGTGYVGSATRAFLNKKYA